MKLFYLFFSCYLLLLNLIGFCLMGIDKYRARNHLYRIPEKTLFLCAALGGPLGSFLGMYCFHHKTRHWYFQLGMPALCLLWIFVCFLILK